jgi:hypothetical protein
MEKLHNAIRIRNEELFKEIKKAAIDENYSNMEGYIEMLHINRKIYNKVKHELRKESK